MILLLTPSVAFISKDGIKYILILESFMFLNNFDVKNYINGVTWTIATLMQLYLIAIPLYKIIKKYDFKGYAFILVLTIVLRKMIFSFIAFRNLDSIYYTVSSIRLPFTTINLFCVGMWSAKYSNKFKHHSLPLYCLFFLPLILTFYHFVFCLFAKFVGSIYGNRIILSSWQSFIGIFIAVLLFLTFFKIEWKTKIGQFIQFIVSNEYGIYGI